MVLQNTAYREMPPFPYHFQLNKQINKMKAEQSTMNRLRRKVMALSKEVKALHRKIGRPRTKFKGN